MTRSDEDDEISIKLEDINLPDTLRDVADIGMPFRIYGWAFKGDDERHETDVSILISCMIDAAIWGAENPEWVLAYQQDKQRSQDAAEELENFLEDGGEVN